MNQADSSVDSAGSAATPPWRPAGAMACREARPFDGRADVSLHPTDHDLLRRCRLRDGHEYFAELYGRHQARAFRLCLRICGNRALAEEALQEGMLAVWRSAATFQTGNEVGRWLLRVVAHRALKAVSKARCRAGRLWAGEPPAPPARDTAEDSEMGVALSLALDRLPAPQRRLIGLYFGGSLSQQEVGRSLKLPQRTVSFRIREVITVLRRELETAGFEA